MPMTTASMDEKEPELEKTGPAGRRGLLRNVAFAGLGALIAADVAACRRAALVPASSTAPASGTTAAAAPSGATSATAGGSSASGAATPGASVSGNASGPLTDDLKLRHLLRRAGFGAGPTELATYQKLGLNGTIDRLIEFAGVDNSALESRLQGLNLDLSKRPDIQRWWLLRMIYTARPLEEKLTLFWHGHLTSAISKVGRPLPMVKQNEFLRANALGRFPDLLKGISKDPAMMVWLDVEANRRGHANENYARELMELFSLGLGNYTETDVRESARAFTGWVLTGNRKTGAVQSIFRPRLHDDGSKTFLGQTGNFNGDDVVDIIVKQPASATFISRKLFEFFAYPSPSDAVLQPLVAAYTSSNYSIKALVRAILTSDAFYSPAAYRALVKSPAELVAGTARVLGVETDAKGLPYETTLMGQELFNPPNVAGWHGGSAWLNSGTWFARLNFANSVVTAVTPALSKRPSGDPVAALLNAAPSSFVDGLSSLFLDGQIEPPQHQVLLDYLTASPALEQRRGAFYLAMALPEFHLA